eukprot:GFUD01095905.1.p1 GENE.GFUD01095905.1~~GFUD01095905.1.p1  ORF type:complete len:204 (-),score=64.03 GFUD01095905.1:121-732(-)
MSDNLHRSYVGPALLGVALTGLYLYLLITKKDDLEEEQETEEFRAACISHDPSPPPNSSQPPATQRVSTILDSSSDTSLPTNEAPLPALPDFNDQEAVQRFFLQEVAVGEELLATGDIQKGVEHLSLAVAVSLQPDSLLSSLKQTLQPQIYQLLLQNLDMAKHRVRIEVSYCKINSIRRQALDLSEFVQKSYSGHNVSGNMDK